MTEPPCIDAVGVAHPPAGDDARIVSLVPSLTELLFDLGLGDQVVGRTAYCRHPQGRVRAAVSVGGTKRVDMVKLQALRPSHIIVNVDATPKGLADACAARGWRVIVTHPIAVRDSLALFRLLGGVFGRAAEACDLCRRFEAAHAAVRSAATRLPPRRVLYLIWQDPWMTVSRDTFIARMLAEVRWQTVPEAAAVRYPEVCLDDATLAGCDLVLFASEPFPFKARHLAAFRAAWPAHALKAHPIDGEMVSWYGSRTIAGLGYVRDLAERIAPAATIG